MSAENFRQRAGATKRTNTYNSFIEAAPTVFAGSNYQKVVVDDVIRQSGRSAPSFYNIFSGKSAWATAVLDRRLNHTLEERPETNHASSVRTRLLGHLTLLGDTITPMPGITAALVEERTKTDPAQPYSQLLPRYHGTLTEIVRSGQLREAFREDIFPEDMADFALDSLAIAYAVPLGTEPGRKATATSLIVSSMQV
jgi:AcrR family transcriptional regulator